MGAKASSHAPSVVFLPWEVAGKGEQNVRRRGKKKTGNGLLERLVVITFIKKMDFAIFKFTESHVLKSFEQRVLALVQFT